MLYVLSKVGFGQLRFFNYVPYFNILGPTSLPPLTEPVLTRGFMTSTPVQPAWKASKPQLDWRCE